MARTPLDQRQPAFFFWLSLLYLAVLLGLGVAYNVIPAFQDQFADDSVGVVPVAVPWFGALGAVTLSLYGVFDHNRDWDTRYNYWHAARPLVGAVFGVVGYFIFVVIITSTGTEIERPDPDSPKAFTYYVLAFLLGYREGTFRSMIQRFVDLILTPEPRRTAAPAASVAAQPLSGPAPLTVSFDSAASTAAPGDSVSYRLDFGDGTPATTGDGVPTSAVTHDYTTRGTYLATLVLTSASGQRGSAALQVVVQ